MKQTLVHAVREMLERHWTVVDMAHRLGVDPSVVAEILRQLAG